MQKQQQQKDEAAQGGAPKKKKVTAAQLRVQRGMTEYIPCAVLASFVIPGGGS
jgi:hypothetical protein